MKDSFVRSTAEVSLLEEKSKSSIRILSQELDHFLDNKDYRRRCLGEVEKGRAQLISRLQEARRTVLFNKEDVIHWLSKVKVDAEAETQLIFIKHHASLFANDSEIDFERIGLLAGIFDEAERFLLTLVAIERLDIEKPHYQILDRLEHLDEFYVKTDNIPGYYAIQADERIAKHAYEIKNLNDYWRDYLSLKDKHSVTSGFGDTHYLLNQYHFEFRWELIKVRPREEIHFFLDFHLKKYKGEANDFLNHVEYRVMPELPGVAHSDYPIYQLLIKDWLRTKRGVLNKVDEEYLLESVSSVSATFLNNVSEYRKMSDENKYNIQIASFLNERFSGRSWTAKDQSMGGSTQSDSKMNRAGVAFRDIVICNERNNHVSAVECFRIKFVPSEVESDSIIKDHLTKIFVNEPIGVSPLFIVIYCETKSFTRTWNKYLEYIEKIDFSEYVISQIDKSIQQTPFRTNVKIARVTHARETNEINVYHVFINMFPENQNADAYL